MKRRHVGVLAFVAAVAAIVCISGIDLPARAAPPSAPAPHDALASSSVTIAKTAVRSNISGSGTDTRDVSLTVGQTADLQGRQEIHVTWSGAHPTGGIVANQNSPAAQLEEYPFVLLECRGVDNSNLPADEQLSPETCWTQTWSERYQDSFNDPSPPYRLDQVASPSERTPISGAPSPLPASCSLFETAPVQDWIPFIAANGQLYPGGSGGCAGEAPESVDVQGSGSPSNETFGVTGTDGSGGANFQVWTSTQNQSLGCSDSVACSLVAIPIMGVTCDASTGASVADLAACESPGAFQPGELMPPTGGSMLTDTGALWWTPSNWRNRISVPLSFSPTAASCSLTGSAAGNAVDVYGSEVLIQATTQWTPDLCSRSSDPFTLDHVQTGEPQARNLVATGGAEAAFTSEAQAGGYGKPVVNAPVAFTGFAISYAIDGSNGQPYTTLKLTPLLLAKLLTESYAGDFFMKQDDPALASNPIDITEDPQFIALNPGIPQYTLGPSESASELISISGGSDVIEALTSYINADPTARAWLDGQPDPNGMVVNPAYKGIQLPISTWPLLSTYEPTAYYQSDSNDCLYNNPVPFQPLVAAPLASLESISESIQFNQPNSTTTCYQPNADTTTGETLKTNSRQSVGSRFLIGITPLADSDRYLLQTAALQTTPGTFVAPTDSSLQATAALLKPDAASGTWPIPYDQFGQADGASAYPGSMVVYAAIPTSGLPTQDAQDYASFLNFASTSGQVQGYGLGQLPPGYLPLTSANDLGSLATYTQSAEADVAAQNGQVPPVAAAVPGSTTNTTNGTSATTPATPTGSVQAGIGYPTGAASSPLYSTSSASKPESTSSPMVGAKKQLPNSKPAGSHEPLIGTFATLLLTSGIVLLLVLGMAFLGLLGVPVTYLAGRRKGRW